jgi:ABC-type transport system substrate-binding protein
MGCGVDESRSAALNRRRLLAGLACTGGVGVAGCLTGSEQSSDPDDATDGVTMLHTDHWNPTETNVNTWASGRETPWWANYVWGGLVVHTNLADELIYGLASESAMGEDNRSYVITYDDEWTFWNGDPVTVEDVLLSTRIQNFRDHRQSIHPDSPVEVHSDSDPIRIEYPLGCPTNPARVRQDLRYETLSLGYDAMREFVERFRDASSADAYEEIERDLTEHHLSLEEFVDEGWGLGLWEPADWGPDYVTHRKVEDHPLADETNLSTWTWLAEGNDLNVDRYVQNGQVDFVRASDIRSLQNPDFDSVHEIGTGAQVGLRFNRRNDHLDKRAVRRAFAYAIDYQALSKDLRAGIDSSTIPIRLQNGTSQHIQRTLMDADTLETFIDYGRRADLESAEATLQDAGYSRNGAGVWEHPDDGELAFDHVTPPWTPYEFSANWLADKLDDFGIRLSVTHEPIGSFREKWYDTYEFDIATWFQHKLHPSAYFDLGSQGSGLGYYQEIVGQGATGDGGEDQANTDTPGGDCAPRTPPLVADRTNRLKQPVHPEHPAEIGARDGPMTELRPFQLVQGMKRAQDDRELRELVHEISWYCNYQMPHVGLYNEAFTHYGNTARYEFPEEGSTLYNTKDAWQWVAMGGVDVRTE